MQMEEKNNGFTQREEKKVNRKISVDPVVSFMLSQSVVCLILLASVLLVRLAGGAVYQTARTQYDLRFGVSTDLKVVTEPPSSSVETETDVVIETAATQSTESVVEIGGGDSPNDAMALVNESSPTLMATALTGKATQHTLVVPVQGTVTSPFGYRIHPIYGTRLFHNGVDIGASEGTSIHSALQGRVTVAQYDSSYGNYIVIDHGNDFCTLYAHCKELKVSEGDVVAKGQTIATVGSTGVSTGPHLHFEIRRGEYRIDPAWLVDLS